MLKINFLRCDGDKKGELCRAIIERACENFFVFCGSAKIEEACNNRREVLMKEWNLKNPHDVMSDYKLPNIAYEQGLLEISPAFKLTEPSNINFSVLENEKSSGNNGEADMEVSGLMNSVTGEFTPKEVRVYLDVIIYSPDNSNLLWQRSRSPIEQSVYHELFHYCGDIKSDGILRHNLIGVSCLLDILSRKDN